MTDYVWRDCCPICGSNPEQSCDAICDEITTEYNRKRLQELQLESLAIAEQDADIQFAARQAEITDEIDIELDRWYPLEFVYPIAE